MKIYTKTGDTGKTGLLGGKRISKADLQIEMHGSMDELNAILGIIISFSIGKKEDKLLQHIQETLFILGLTLALKKPNPKFKTFDAEETAQLEKEIDFYEARNQPLRNFILPGGGTIASFLHFARAVCRRAERKLIQYIETIPNKVWRKRLQQTAIPYLNRLSDFLFVLARYENRKEKKETIWKGVLPAAGRADG